MKRLILSLLLLAGFASLQAQEAFYIYRNDGEFNGFFYDDVKSMRLSKTDLDLTERDEYVVQEIETKDSVYRIPLCAIDSIGFQQPEIIFSKRFYNLKADDCPYKGSYIRVFDNEGNEVYRMDWYPQAWDESSNRWIYSEQYLPKVGDVLYIPDGEWDGWSGKYALPFICKVTKVEQYEGSSSYGVYYDYVDSFDDVFEQFVSVEQIGHDDNGVAYSRMAGLNKTPVGYSGNDNLTLASVSGKFTPHPADKFLILCDELAGRPHSLKQTFTLQLCERTLHGIGIDACLQSQLADSRKSASRRIYTAGDLCPEHTHDLLIDRLSTFKIPFHRQSISASVSLCYCITCLIQ